MTLFQLFFVKITSQYDITVFKLIKQLRSWGPGQHSREEAAGNR